MSDEPLSEPKHPGTLDPNVITLLRDDYFMDLYADTFPTPGSIAELLANVTTLVLFLNRNNFGAAIH